MATITDVCEATWAALRASSALQHGTVWDGDSEGTATTDTPGVGTTKIDYKYDSSAGTLTYQVKSAPAAVTPEVVEFALGASVAQVCAAPTATK